MAKRAAVKTKGPRALTDDEVKRVGERLRHTVLNIYITARSMFGRVRVDDETFERVEKLCGLFRCEDCNEWLETSNRDDLVEDHCELCAQNSDD